jgi:hypothetical protein
MTSMKKLLISFSGGLLLLCVWGAIVVVTSQDFAHEGPNSFWFSPVDAWSRVVVYTGWPEKVSSFSPVLGILLGAAMLLGPFILALSAAVHTALWSLRRMIAGRKLS